MRGNARQVYEKYLSLARDATSAGDRVAAEAYFQHAEHYFRILSDSTDPTPSGRRQEDRQPQHYSQDEGYDGDDDLPVNGASGTASERPREPGNGHPAASSAPRDDGRAPAEAAPAGNEAQGGTPDGEAGPARARRGRPRKPRPSDDGQPRTQEPTPETESGPAVG